ncbi:MAG TPA: hypothetical protein VGQ30_14495 [Gemmatimonadaceae bacterium]|jgi:hypothetical protein|nr:hypothetical protein [Gemmatimonadaceae bacterium]
MKNATYITIGALVALAAVNTASAQTATQTVTFQVTAINQIAVTGTPSLVINAAAAGSAPTSVTASGNTWSVTTNQSGASITASIPTAMPAGLTLSANLTAPAGATSTGLTALGATAVNVVTGITKLNAAALALSYQLDATAAAGVVTSSTRVVTYTITGGV